MFPWERDNASYHGVRNSNRHGFGNFALNHQGSSSASRRTYGANVSEFLQRESSYRSRDSGRYRPGEDGHGPVDLEWLSGSAGYSNQRNTSRGTRDADQSSRYASGYDSGYSSSSRHTFAEPREPLGGPYGGYATNGGFRGNGFSGSGRVVQPPYYMDGLPSRTRSYREDPFRFEPRIPDSRLRPDYDNMYRGESSRYMDGGLRPPFATMGRPDDNLFSGLRRSDAIRRPGHHHERRRR